MTYDRLGQGVLIRVADRERAGSVQPSGVANTDLLDAASGLLAA